VGPPNQPRATATRWIKVTGGYLNISLLQTVKYKSIKDVVDIYHTPNEYGLFRSKISKVTAFYVTSPNLSPRLNHHMPGGRGQFVKEIVATSTTIAATDSKYRAATARNNTTTNWQTYRRVFASKRMERCLGGSRLQSNLLISPNIQHSN
jgi:hypothetical protein